ncbi:hypothetical protein [Roseibium litorale]|uniref:Uncharacterized protein n=1 Tax=Roseibium litorale TaxID=2803841 RepID=A0ABR9CGP7_9HYPH|nr:hypothetical protein [Roseibium litorale]MBD8890063.1 hypothetical protein [Roseibium litorale]
MSFAPQPKDADVTIGELKSRDQRLGINCNYCGRFRYMADNQFRASTVVAGIAGNLTCARCGSDDVETFAVARTEKHGYWPAERS